MDVVMQTQKWIYSSDGPELCQSNQHEPTAKEKKHLFSVEIKIFTSGPNIADWHNL